MLTSAYKPLVISLATGPRAVDMEIILPIRLAKNLADSSVSDKTLVNWTCNVEIFSYSHRT